MEFPMNTVVMALFVVLPSDDENDFLRESGTRNTRIFIGGGVSNRPSKTTALSAGKSKRAVVLPTGFARLVRAQSERTHWARMDIYEFSGIKLAASSLENITVDLQDGRLTIDFKNYTGVLSLTQKASAKSQEAPPQKETRGKLKPSKKSTGGLLSYLSSAKKVHNDNKLPVDEVVQTRPEKKDSKFQEEGQIGVSSSEDSKKATILPSESQDASPDEDELEERLLEELLTQQELDDGCNVTVSSSASQGESSLAEEKNPGPPSAETLKVEDSVQKHVPEPAFCADEFKSTPVTQHDESEKIKRTRTTDEDGQESSDSPNQAARVGLPDVQDGESTQDEENSFTMEQNAVPAGGQSSTIVAGVKKVTIDDKTPQAFEALTQYLDASPFCLTQDSPISGEIADSSLSQAIPLKQPSEPKTPGTSKKTENLVSPTGKPKKRKSPRSAPERRSKDAVEGRVRTTRRRKIDTDAQSKLSFSTSLTSIPVPDKENVNHLANRLPAKIVSSTSASWPLPSLNEAEWSLVIANSNAQSSPSPRWGHTVNRISKSRLLVYGGSGEEGSLPDVNVFDLATKKWSAPVNTCNVPRMWHSSTFLPGRDLLLVWGGETVEGEALDTAMVLDTEIYLWYPPAVSGKSPPARSGHTACLIGSDVVVFGGCRGRNWLNDVFVLDTDRWHWTRANTVGKAPKGRTYHSATAVGDSMVIFGGNDQNVSFNTVHVLRKEEGDSWSWIHPEVVGDVPPARTGHSACLVGESVLMVHGGWDPQSADEDGEIFSDCYFLDTINWEWRKGPQPAEKALSGFDGHRVGHGCVASSEEGRTEIYTFGGLNRNEDRSNDVISLVIKA